LNQTKILDFKLVKILLYFRAGVHVLDRIGKKLEVSKARTTRPPSGDKRRD